MPNAASGMSPPMHLSHGSRVAFVLVVVVTALAACASAPRRPDGGVGLLPVGAEAPEVVGEAPSGEAVRLSASRGHAAVVYFYPRDATPGCTKEACAFRDAWDEYARDNVQVFGVSAQSSESHRAFQREHKLPFPLVADESGEVQRAYGVGKGLFGYQRVTFLVGPDGRVARVWPDVDPGVHAREVLDAARNAR
jgi:peroxiredoxin Q/BCP